jgi:5-methylcytosine-specific restriction endonuclease McrA
MSDDPLLAQARHARYRERNRLRLREQAREIARQRRAKNPEPARIACRAYYLRNLEKMRERGRKQARENPEAARARVYARRARKKGASVRERVYRSVVWRRDEGTCHICNLPCDPNRWDMDHVVPLARGGDHSYANIRVAHPVCNNSKRTRLMSELVRT